VIPDDRVHPDAIAKQRTSRSTPGWIDRDDGDPVIREIGAESKDEFVEDRGLARTSGAGESDHRDVRIRCGITDRIE
jgi:hypothetical protein